MKVLVLGHRSFAARGLREALHAAGHEVTCFSRGPVGESDGVVTGPVEEVDRNPHLQQPFDTVVNYILLKDDGIEKNVAYVAAVVRLCRERGVKHLVQISSISSFAAGLKRIDEAAATESVPLRKGAYGSLKVATDLYLRQELGKEGGTKLSLVRPGFILGPGVVNPIVGTAARLPWNKVLIIGNAASVMPLIKRESLNEALVKVVGNPPSEGREVLLLAAGNSPTRWAFIEACCRNMGIGLGAFSLPVWVWYGIAVGAEAAARLLGQGKMAPYSKLSARLAGQQFDARRTEERVGMTFSFDWPPVLRDALEGQGLNYDLPPAPRALPRTGAGAVGFLGFGRIVKQKHLPALKALGFAGQVKAYDLRAGTDAGGQVVEAIAGAALGKADLFVVASPGPAHAKALESLGQAAGPVLVEKPLCYTTEELGRWEAFTAGRQWPVYVCHNYRFKGNVRRMAELLRAHNPGQLKHVQVYFQSPPVGNDGAPWLRAERKARTLLMDYSLHFLDLACMFGNQPWKVDGVRYEIDQQGNTGLIEGRLLANYSIGFLLRQGFAPRRARVLLSFQNYTVSLGFFPDTFAVYMADDNPWQYKAEKKESWRGTVGKIRDKLLNRDSDLSHALVLGGALGDLPEIGTNIEVAQVASFYRMLLELADAVYGDGKRL